MKIALALIMLTSGIVVSSAALAQNNELRPAAVAHPTGGDVTSMDTTQFCYFAGQAYSEGAVLQNNRCQRDMTVFANGKPGHLSWVASVNHSLRDGMSKP